MEVTVFPIHSDLRRTGILIADIWNLVATVCTVVQMLVNLKMLVSIPSYGKVTGARHTIFEMERRGIA